MILLVVRDYAAVSLSCVEVLQKWLSARQSGVFALPTGATPIGFYRALVAAEARGDVCLQQCAIFNLDEYLDLPRGHPLTFRSFMHRHLLGLLQSQPLDWFIPDSFSEDPVMECEVYEMRIREAGGLDVTFLGLGPNGHIAFNEPGTDWGLWTHVAELAPETQAFLLQQGAARPPRRAITMGVRTLMNSRRLVLVVSGHEKSAVLARALRGPVDPSVPASVLQLHPRCLVIADVEAARDLPALSRLSPADTFGLDRVGSVQEVIESSAWDG